MSEKIEQLLSNLATIIKDFLGVQGLELDTQKAERTILDEIFKRLDKILPFLHEEIEIKYWRNGSRDREEFHETKGICLVNEFERENTGSYSHEDNYWDYKGFQIWLSDNLELLKVSRNGSGSAWAGDSSSWESKTEIITLEQLQKETSFKMIINNLIKIFEEAIKTNESKRNILQSRQKLLQTIKSIIGVPSE